MGVMKGLSLDGAKYFSEFVSGDKKPDWLEFSTQIGKLTGNYAILNYMTGYSNLQRFLFRVPKWPIGGMYFDGILHTEHSARVRPTQYPVQTGVVMTDHAVIEPAEVSIEVMMCNSTTNTYVSTNPILNSFYQSVQGLQNYSNVKWLMGGASPVTMPGDERSVNAWKALREMQVARVPITVETRLQTYNNMIIEELTAPDDAKTMNALKCTVRLREIIFSGVSEIKTSARASSTAGESSSGQVPADVPEQGSILYEAQQAASNLGRTG